MTVVLTGQDRRTQLGVLLLDALLTENIEFGSEVTLYPVEDGTLITDHITEGPEKIRIGGVVSVADVSGGGGILGSLGFTVNNQNQTKLIDVIEALSAMHKARQLVTVSTGQLVYRDMAFTMLSAKRSADGIGGNWVSVDAELVKVRKVKLKTADVPPPENMNAPASGRGGETNKPAGQTTSSGSSSGGGTNASSTGETQNQSVLYGLKNGGNDTFLGRMGGAMGIPRP